MIITPNSLLTCFAKLSETEIKTFMAPAQLEIQQVFDDERFPNVVVTPHGTVLASWGSPNIRVRRSEDGGLTWGEEITIAKSGFHEIEAGEEYPESPPTICCIRDCCKIM